MNHVLRPQHIHIVSLHPSRYMIYKNRPISFLRYKTFQYFYYYSFSRNCTHWFFYPWNRLNISLWNKADNRTLFSLWYFIHTVPTLYSYFWLWSILTSAYSCSSMSRFCLSHNIRLHCGNDYHRKQKDRTIERLAGGYFWRNSSCILHGLP